MCVLYPFFSLRLLWLIDRRCGSAVLRAVGRGSGLYGILPVALSRLLPCFYAAGPVTIPFSHSFYLACNSCLRPVFALHKSATVSFLRSLTTFCSIFSSAV